MDNQQLPGHDENAGRPPLAFSERGGLMNHAVTPHSDAHMPPIRDFSGTASVLDHPDLKEPLWQRLGSIIFSGIFWLIFIGIMVLNVTLRSHHNNAQTNGVTDASPSQNVPIPSTTEVNRAVEVGRAWANYVAQGNFQAAYNLEAIGYQEQYNLAQQRTALAGLQLPDPNFRLLGSTSGLRGDNTMAVAAVFQPRQPNYYLEVILENDSGAWRVSGYNSSPTPINPHVPL